VNAVKSDLVVKVMDWTAAKARARPIRIAVFVEEQGVPLDLEWDEFDELAEHAIAIDDTGRAVATGRLLPDGHIGRMAVLRDVRGRGAGAAVLGALIARARARGMTVLRLNAQTHAAAFYARFGFAGCGETFLEAGIPHVAMRLEFDQRG
jgi:predicted GNAT family N-acyltransferase